jgi:hypothetical protein
MARVSVRHCQCPGIYRFMDTLCRLILTNVRNGEHNGAVEIMTISAKQKWSLFRGAEASFSLISGKQDSERKCGVVYAAQPAHPQQRRGVRKVGSGAVAFMVLLKLLVFCFECVGVVQPVECVVRYPVSCGTFCSFFECVSFNFRTFRSVCYDDFILIGFLIKWSRAGVQEPGTSSLCTSLPVSRYLSIHGHVVSPYTH